MVEERLRSDRLSSIGGNHSSPLSAHITTENITVNMECIVTVGIVWYWGSLPNKQLDFKKIRIYSIDFFCTLLMLIMNAFIF